MKDPRPTTGRGAVLRVLTGQVGLREGLVLGLALTLLSALPFIVAKTPQLTDYASHLARYYIMLDGGHDPFLAHYYEFRWQLTGNLGADLLVWPLGKLLGVEVAGRIIGLIIPLLTGLGVVAVEWVLRRRVSIGSVLAFVFVWSPAMGMGFYNFCLSLAFALLAFALWVRLEGKSWRWMPFVPIGLVTWLCHVSGWGVLGVLVFGYEFHRRKGVAGGIRGIIDATLSTWPLLFPLIPMLLGGAKSGLPPGASPWLLYGNRIGFYKYSIWFQAMRDQWRMLDMATLWGTVLVLGIALILRRFDGRLGWAALLMFVLTFAVPRHLGGGDYADYRLIAVALMVGCMAIDWSAPRWLFWLAPALFLFRIGLTTEAWERHSRQLSQDLQALAYMPQGARVAGAVVVEMQGWALNPFEHAPSFATLRRNALVNSHFAIPGVHMLRLRGHDADFVDPSHRIIHWNGQKIDLKDFKPASKADYLWYFGYERPDSLPPGATILFANRHSFLARLANRPVPR